jgi:hypothetical protein
MILATYAATTSADAQPYRFPMGHSHPGKLRLGHHDGLSLNSSITVRRTSNVKTGHTLGSGQVSHLYGPSPVLDDLCRVGPVERDHLLTKIHEEAKS